MALEIQHLELSFCDYYQRKARTTARYPNQGGNLAYAALGLTGEISELMVKMLDGAPRESIMLELGDVLWYVSAVAFEANLQLSEIAYGAAENAVHVPDYSDLSVGIRTAFIIGAGAICERAKKIIRDKDGVLEHSDRAAVRGALQAVYHAWLHSCNCFAMSPELVAQKNLDKLFARVDVGTIHGEGDTR